MKKTSYMTVFKKKILLSILTEMILLCIFIYKVVKLFEWWNIVKYRYM